MHRSWCHFLKGGKVEAIEMKIGAELKEEQGKKPPLIRS
jgi:hypothetical protein